jgi:hypothetical protein
MAASSCLMGGCSMQYAVCRAICRTRRDICDEVENCCLDNEDKTVKKDFATQRFQDRKVRSAIR